MPLASQMEDLPSGYTTAGVSWLDIDGGETDYEKGQRAVVRNITASDISAKLHDLAHRSPTCAAEKNGVVVCTPPT